MTTRLAIASLDEFEFGRAPRPVRCGHGLVLGSGTVVPEVNFTLPDITIDDHSWPEICRQYEDMIGGVLERAVQLEVPGLLIEFEALPAMTVRPEWGLEITRILAARLLECHRQHGLATALRLTPNDVREFARPPLMRSGRYWDAMVEFFNGAGAAGADLLSIESTGGKEVSDDALMRADLGLVVFALGVLGARDMRFLWDELTGICARAGIVPAGDTACGFGNTAMVLAEQGMLPRVFAAAVRVASVPRSLVAYEAGAVGPSKDCAYEGPYMKAIAGVPISMEGRTAACAHLSSIGNVSQAVCDCWSNESVQNVRMLSAAAPVVSLEQLAYDCRLMNTAQADGEAGARRLRDWLALSDAPRDPQAFVLRPDVVLRVAGELMAETTPYLRTRRGVQAALAELRQAQAAGELRLAERERRWLDRFAREADRLPACEEDLLAAVLRQPVAAKFKLAEYGLAG